MRMSKRADPHGLRSKHRSALRLCLGTAYYSARRYLLWMSGKYRFASQRQKDRLPCVHMAHHTPLLRKLKDVEMQYQHNKITNLKLAVARLDGIVVQPGETLSYWKLIGRPTYRKGYLDGVLLKNGTVQYGCGGGLCQLSNLIFWMTLHTPLEVKERHRHGYDVFPDSNRTQPFGSGATCFYPYGDLMIYNPTDRPFQLRLRVGEKPQRHHVVRVVLLSLQREVPSAVQMQQEEQPGRLDPQQLRMKEFQKSGLPRGCSARRGGESATSCASASRESRAQA